MTTLSVDSPLSIREHRRQVVLRAADEAWTLGELAEALGVSKQTATTYAEQAGLEITRSAVRHPRRGDV
jgi:DNA-directed RNA polymerase specialized sigma24 family protein